MAKDTLTTEQKLKVARLEQMVANSRNQIAGCKVAILTKQSEIEKLQQDQALHEASAAKAEADLAALGIT